MPDGVVFVLANEKRLQNQVYRQIKSKLMDTFRSGKSSPFERVGRVDLLKELTSPCVVSYLHFLNLNNNLTLPKLLLPLKLCSDMTNPALFFVC